MNNIITVPGGTADDSPAILTAFNDLPDGGQLILSPATVYTLQEPVQLLGKHFSLYAEGATVKYVGADNQIAVVAGFNPGDKNCYTPGVFIHGLSITYKGSTGQFYNNTVGLRLQNTYAARIYDLQVSGFGVGLELAGNGVGCTYGYYSLLAMKNNRTQIHCTATNGGYISQSTIVGPGMLTYDSPYKGQSCQHLLTEADSTSEVSSLILDHLSFEAQDSNCLVAHIAQGRYIHWLVCRYETVDKSLMPLILDMGTDHNVLWRCTTPNVSWQDAEQGNTGNSFFLYG